MTDSLEKYTLECQEIFLKFKTLLYSKTSISEQNKAASLDDFSIYGDLVGKIQLEIGQKLQEFNEPLNLTQADSHLVAIGKDYILQFASLVDLKTT